VNIKEISPLTHFYRGLEFKEKGKEGGKGVPIHATIVFVSLGPQPKSSQKGIEFIASVPGRWDPGNQGIKLESFR